MNEKAARIIALAKEHLGDPYVFGALGEYCTSENRRKRVRSDKPTIVSKCQVLNGSKTTCDGCAYNGKRMYDCRGFTYFLLKQVGITISTVGATTQWKTTKDWAEQGLIKDMPLDKVCCVFKDVNGIKEHTGMHIGNKQIIHCSGTVKTGKTTDKGWTHYAIPKGLYSDEELNGERVIAVPDPVTLRKGSKGDDVKILQQQLLQLGYSLPKYGADGDFGSETKAAVKQFQKDHKIQADGIVGAETFAALALALQQQTANPAPDPAPAPDLYTVTIQGLDEATAKALMEKYPGAELSVG